jgi:hypothetical protein
MQTPDQFPRIRCSGHGHRAGVDHCQISPGRVAGQLMTGRFKVPGIGFQFALVEAAAYHVKINFHLGSTSKLTL